MFSHVAKVACPVLCTLVPESQLDFDLNVFVAQNFLGTHFVDIFGLAVNENGERSGTICGNERNADAF